MCGIIGYIGNRSAAPILLEGLKKLEYRGYDSAGLALHLGTELSVCKKQGRVINLLAAVEPDVQSAHLGISHTRWATHGEVNDINAHPHTSCDQMIALVHNGVIENYAKIRAFLENEQYTFTSATDTEVLANLIAYEYAQLKQADVSDPFLEAVRKSLLQIKGTYGIAVLCKEVPDILIGARKGSPLCVGIGKQENMIGSDIRAFLGRTQDVVYLEDGQLVHLSADNFSVSTVHEQVVDPVIRQINWHMEEAELGGFAHFMEKEIFEQPQTLENAMRGRFADDGSTAKFGGLNLDAHQWRHIDRILICACGTTWHAALVAEHLIEKYARIPVEVEYASEFRYRNAPIDKHTLLFVISQSGETLDTLEALRESKRKGLPTLAITNTVGSTIARESDGGIYQHSGPEIGVASTKAFTAQLLLSAMLAIYLGRLRDLSFAAGTEAVQALQSVPALVDKLLEQKDTIRNIARRYAHSEDMLFLGRLNMFPIALEGALKMKEISYLHAEGYPAAEMKHGPIALISANCPSVVLAPHGALFDKVLSNIREIRARKGRVLAVTSAPDFPKDAADDILYIPQAHDCIQPILATIPLQLLSYYIAVERGCDVDKPRNLAKSVTVE